MKVGSGWNCGFSGKSLDGFEPNSAKEILLYSFTGGVFLPVLVSSASEVIHQKHSLQEKNPVQLEQQAVFTSWPQSRLKLVGKCKDGRGRGSTVEIAAALPDPVRSSQGAVGGWLSHNWAPF